MSWPTFYAAGSAWLFALAVPVIIFYFLKLKRPRVQVPSLALWRQVIHDQRVNSPFQKFKRNLLLWLQLLLLSLLTLAAMQPFFAGSAKRAQYIPILIDCSASMGALDKAGGQSRLDAAKERVRELIDGMLPDQQLSLIAFHSSARRVTEFTNNRQLLREGLSQLTVSDMPSRAEEALRMTQALARTVPLEKVVIFSDGNLPPKIDFDLPFELNFQRLPVGGPNLGITGCNARRGGAAGGAAPQWDVFVRMEASAAASASVELRQDGRVIGSEPVSLDPGKSQRILFHVESSAPSRIEIRVKPEGFDSLESDNLAYLDLPAARALTAYIPLEMAGYRHAFKKVQGLQLTPDEKGVNTRPTYDLLITDRREDRGIDAGVSLFVGMVPDDLQKIVRIEEGSASIVDWQRNSELLQHVLLTDLQIADEPKQAPETTEGQYEKLGYETLAHSRTGPLILKRRNGAKTAYWLLFHTDHSTLPYRVGFPILASNLIQIALDQAELTEVPAHRTGVLPPLSVEPAKKFQIVGPDRNSVDVQSSEEGVLNGVAAQLIGRYEITGGSAPRSIGVSLLDSLETSLSTVDDLRFREVNVKAAETTLKSDRPLWPLLALLAFGVLLVEWWYYQRPPPGPETIARKK